jgi:sugar phosphate isomerase/epimerase
MADYPYIEDVMAQIQALGFWAFDLAAAEGWQNVNPSLLINGGGIWAQKFSLLVEESGLRVSSINCIPGRPLNDPMPGSFDHYKREYLAVLKLARTVNCPNITLQPGKVIKALGAKGSFELAQEHLTELSILNQGSGVTLSLEAHQGSILEKPEAALRMLEPLWPGVGLTYDPSHFVMQNISLQETEALFPYTVHVHVRSAAPGKMQETMAQGTVDFEWLIPALRQHGYDGAVAIEYFSGFDKDFESTRALRELLLKLGVEAGGSAAA